MVHKAKYGRTPPEDQIMKEVKGFVRFSIAVAVKAQKIIERTNELLNY